LIWIKVFLVDDSPDYVTAVKSWLELWPELLLVGIANNGEDALRLVEETHPDLVLMDVSMPVLNGFETLKLIKQLSRPPAVIMLTLDDDRTVRLGARDAGADDFIPKTALTTALLPAIARLFPATAAASPELATPTASLTAEVVGVAPMLVVSVSLSGIVLFANRAVSEATGYAVRELVGQNWWELLRTPSNRAQLDEWLGSSHADPLEVDMTLTMRSGDERLISWRLSKTRNARGEIAEILLVGADVTGRAWTERALQRFANYVSAATGARFFELLVEYVSSCLGFDIVMVGELTPSEPDEVRTIAAFPPGIMPEEFAQTIAGTPCERVAHGEFLTYSTGLQEAFPCAPNLRRYGLDAYVGAPLVASDGRVIGLICGFGHEAVGDQAVAEMMFRIVAGRAAAELERELAMRDLERSEAMFRGLIEQTQDVVALIDADDAFTYVSPAAQRLFGHPPSATIGMKVIDLVHPSNRDQIQGLLDAREAAKDPRFLVQARIRHADGSWRDVESSVAEYFDAEGHRFRVVTTRDLTERKRLEEHLQQAQKTEMIGRLAAGIAHDFGNILMVIRSHADILELRTSADDERRVFVDAIQETVTRGTGLARQLLAFNQQRNFEPRRFDLTASIEQMTKLLRRLVGSGICLDTTLASDCGVIVADPTQVEQVVLNLLVNARDAMPSGGAIRIETRRVAGHERPPALEEAPGGYVCLSVTDTGCGIPTEVRNRIFDPLFTTKEEGHGTGLGLATVKGIVERHHGAIEVDSEVGKGTTFRIYLPRQHRTIDGVNLADQAEGVV
jgi:PAS domain S-box-containing protein